MPKPTELPVNLPALRALYQHLGGEAKLREIVLDFYNRMERDVMIGFFFHGRDIEAIAGKQSEFLLKAMGATSSYQGKAPADAHADLPRIKRGQFDRRLKILEETLLEHQLAAEDIRSWLGFENAFRSVVED